MKFSGLVNIIIRNIFQLGGKHIIDWVWLILANMSESAKNAISQKPVGRTKQTDSSI